jgi:hypothetical protein
MLPGKLGVLTAFYMDFVGLLRQITNRLYLVSFKTFPNQMFFANVLCLDGDPVLGQWHHMVVSCVANI